MRSVLLIFILTILAAPLIAQEAPASPTLMTLGPIDGESDQKSSVITLRYDSKPGFAKPVVEAHGTFLQIVLPNTIVLKPGVFQEGNSPYIRKFAPFQLDEDTAALRLFVTKEAENLVPAVSIDILENRVLVIVDHEKAERALVQNFSGVPVAGGPTPDQVLKQIEVRADIPDPISLLNRPKVIEVSAFGPEVAPGEPAVQAPRLASTATETLPAMSAADSVAAAAAAKASLKKPLAPGEIPEENPRWADTIETKLIAVTIFCALMLGLMIAIKSWRKVAVKALPPGADFSLKTLATHALGPKQKITVIQVGQEQILLGVSPDGINFLTSLRPQSENGVVSKMQIDSTPFPKTLMPSPKRSPSYEGAEPLTRPSTLSRSEAKPIRNVGVEPGSSIRYGVGDEGIRNFKGKGGSRSESNDESLEDVTRLIRKKLKDLPKV